MGEFLLDGFGKLELQGRAGGFAAVHPQGQGREAPIIDAERKIRVHGVAEAHPSQACAFRRDGIGKGPGAHGLKIQFGGYGSLKNAERGRCPKKTCHNHTP